MKSRYCAWKITSVEAVAVAVDARRMLFDSLARWDNNHVLIPTYMCIHVHCAYSLPTTYKYHVHVPNTYKIIWCSLRLNYLNYLKDAIPAYITTTTPASYSIHTTATHYIKVTRCKPVGNIIKTLSSIPQHSLYCDTFSTTSLDFYLRPYKINGQGKLIRNHDYSTFPHMIPWSQIVNTDWKNSNL